MKEKLQNLNKQQKQAVEHGNGPLLIVAGAGTGKTHVITKRIAHLIHEKKVTPEEILALTFTDKAAGEMEERVDLLLDESYIDLWVMTFHAFCKRTLQMHGLDIGLPTDFNLLNTTDSWLFIRKHLNKFELDYYKPLGSPTKFIRALVSHFGRCKDQNIAPQDYLNYAKTIKDEEEKARVKEVAQAYFTYQQILLNENSLDFGDLINYTIQLFEKRPHILEQYQEKFKYILVDEFQDTNWAQYKLVKMLSLPNNNLTVCGDGKQAIYRFRGASYGTIVQFCNDFPTAKRVILDQNYRSHQEILDVAHKSIQNNPQQFKISLEIGKKLEAVKGVGGRVEHLHFKTLEKETRGVINKIVELKTTNKEINFGDFAILVRANNTAQAFCRTLERNNIPYSFSALKGLYSKPIILDTISYFKLLDDYHESPALYRILNLPFFQIPNQEIALITRWSRRKSKSIYSALQELSLIKDISKKTEDKVVFLLSIIEKHTELAKHKGVSEVFISFLEDIGYLDHLTKTMDKKSIDYINQFYSKINAFEAAHMDAGLPNFMREIEMEIESGEEGSLAFDSEQGLDAIRIMTIHRAKGLEFKYVFIVNLVDRRFPAIGRGAPIEIPEVLTKEPTPEKDIHLQEERRLFYVAMTRAKEGLFLTSAEDYGGVRKKKLSRFLAEIGFTGKDMQVVDSSAHLHSPKQATASALDKKMPMPKYFSYTQFMAFENCPLQYKFAHIFKIPMRGKAVFSYGKTLHNALERFVQEDLVKKRSLDDLLIVYKEEWIDDWFDSKAEKKDYFEQGVKSLERFYNNYRKNQPEVLQVNGVPALEQGFKLKINQERIIGKIDRIDKIKGGVELIDYKTGKPKDKLEKKDKEQLLIYQIACEKALGLSPQKLSYHYLNTGETLSFLGSTEEKEKQEEKIKLLIENIKKSEFEPTPGWQCKFCDFKNICEHSKTRL